MKFSERYGYKSVKEKLQIDSIDKELRNTLWNLLTEYYWDEVTHSFFARSLEEPLLKLLWKDFLKEPIDDMSEFTSAAVSQIKDYYYQFNWYEVYDFIEFISQQYPDERTNKGFRKECNKVLEKECSAYRFVGKQITQLTSKEEIESIEEAIEESNDLVASHLVRSLELLSDRKSPDYRNSIKESISAVESLVQKTVGKKGTLGQLIEKIEEHFELHPAIKESFKKLYGYTSDKDGIRHAMLDEPSLDFEDAKFMLVTCSAFINYVNGKLEKNNSIRT
jgi:hypothetical protein